MSPQQALHLMLSQQSLELRGWHFGVLPPYRFAADWGFAVWHDSARKDAKVFSRPQRHDALAQALHYAEMKSVELKPAPAEVAAE
jgi:hypothetical protein